MIDTERIVALRSSLAADGYHLEIAEEGTRVHATISATPQACADCLVPKDMMRIYFEATHARTLEWCTLAALQAHAAST